MNYRNFTIIVAIMITSTFISASAFAEQTIRCESHDHAYKFCPVETHGYVRLDRQISKHTDCRQGRNWDFDRRGIWVDDNCKGVFVVEDRHHSSGHEDHHGKEAVAAVAALALIAAAASANKDNNNYNQDRNNHYQDKNYGHGGHSSYIPNWMVGEFTGYNLQYGAQVEMHISSDGRMRAHVDGVNLTGYVNDQRAYIGDSEFYIDRAGDGFNTTQVGHESNKVHYSRK